MTDPTLDGVTTNTVVVSSSTPEENPGDETNIPRRGRATLRASGAANYGV